MVVFRVLDSGGQAASATQLIKVAAPGISSSLHGRFVRVTVDQAGTVSVGRKSKQLAQAGTVSFKLKLTNGQRRQLNAQHALKVRLKISFAPLFGQTTTKKVAVRLRG
jgi:hypothetical protein